MHELAIAQAIVAVAERHAGGRTVRKVEVRVGHLRQVVPEPLCFAFSLLTEGTPLDGAELVITHVSARGRCRDCDAESALEGFPLRCARCGGLELELLSGEELVVDALELDQQATLNERVGHGSHV